MEGALWKVLLMLNNHLGNDLKYKLPAFLCRFQVNKSADLLKNFGVHVHHKPKERHKSIKFLLRHYIPCKSLSIGCTDISLKADLKSTFADIRSTLYPR